MAQAIRVIHDTDPKEQILSEVGELAPQVRPLGAQLLVAVYERPKKTAGGIMLPEQTVKEDTYQGKVGLILDMGPIAFEEDDSHCFGDRKPGVGDWVMFSVGDTFGFELGRRRCRLVEDVHVKAIVDAPDIVL